MAEKGKEESGGGGGKQLAPVIVIKKKKGGHGGSHGGAWKVAYADFVTAMMAFFLVMWLVNSSQATRAAVQDYFQHVGSGSPISEFPTDPKGGDNLDPFEKRSPASGQPMDMPAGKVNAASADDDLQNMKQRLEETISLELGVSNPSENLEMTYDSKGLVLRIAAKGFFSPNESEVHEDLLPMLFRIGKVLATSRNVIRIEGDNDNTELTAAGGPNWQLSTERAAWVASYWMKSFPTIKPERLEVAGQAHFHPIADNSTAEGRAVNRRIEIIVLNEQYTKEAPAASNDK